MRYTFLEPLEGGGWSLGDAQAPGARLIAREVPMRPDVDEVRRRLSWIRDPHADVPVDLLEYGGHLFEVRPEVRGEPLERRLQRGEAGTEWLPALCELLEQLQETPAVVHSFRPENVLVDTDGRVGLVGFVLDASGTPVLGSPAQGPVLASLQTFLPPRLRARKFRTLALLRSLLLEEEAPPAPRRPWVRHGFFPGLALAGLCACLVVSGVQLERSVRRHLPLPLVTLAALPDEPEGRFVWVEGTVRAEPRLRSPLGGVSCVAWHATLSRQVRRNTLDRETGSYGLQVTEQKLLDRTRIQPFDLADGERILRIDPESLLIQGWERRFPRLPDADAFGAGDEVHRVRQTLGKVKIGQEIVGVEGREVAVRSGTRILLGAVVSREGEKVTLSAPRGGTMILYAGSRWSCAAAGAVAAAPAMLGALVCGALFGLLRGIRRRERFS